MLFPLYQSTLHPELQRQLDADQQRWSRLLQLETDCEFNDEERTSFRMNGLFGEIPGSDNPPLRMGKQS